MIMTFLYTNTIMMIQNTFNNNNEKTKNKNAFALKTSFILFILLE